MKVIYKKYAANQDIPVFDYVTKRKLTKYHTRETMAAMVAMGELYKDQKPPADMPFFYSTGELEYLDYYRQLSLSFTEEERNTPFTGSFAVEKAMPRMSPLDQFKIMRNMTQCLISMEYGLKGDNALFLDSLQGLLLAVKISDYNDPVLIGAGKLYSDGSTECGFAEMLSDELTNFSLVLPDDDPLEFFRQNSQ